MVDFNNFYVPIHITKLNLLFHTISKTPLGAID